MQPVFAYRKSAYLDALPAYNIWQGSEQSLDLARKIVESDKYIFLAYGFPDGNGIVAGVSTNVFTPRQTFEGSILVEPLAYLVSVTAEYVAIVNEDLDPTVAAAGFRMQVYDKGSHTFMFDRTFGKDHASWGVMRDLGAGGPIGPYFLRSPMIVIPLGNGSGQLSVEITSLEQTNNQFIQVMFGFAVPKSSRDPRSIVLRSPSLEVERQGGF